MADPITTKAGAGTPRAGLRRRRQDERHDRRRRQSLEGGRWAHRLFIAPSVLTLVVLGLYPLVFILITAFSESSLGRPFQDWAGTANLETVIADPTVPASLLRVAVYAVVVAVASLVLGVVTALALESATRGGALVRTLMLLPLITPPIIVGNLWKLIFNPSGGLLNTVASFFGYSGEPIAILSSTDYALWGIALADVWEWSPLIALLVFAALLGRDREVVEAASLDGAHGWRMLRSITLPAVAGTIAAAFFIRLVLALKVHDLVAIMTSGGPGSSTTVPSILIQQAALQQFDLGRGAAITLLLALVVTAVTLPAALIARRAQR